MGNRRQFESVLSHIYMFNILTKSLTAWYDIFINLSLSFLFIMAILYYAASVYMSISNTNFFFNILTLLVIITIFLFYHNSGAFAGFLFLCEINSLFMIYVLLNKIQHDELVSLSKKLTAVKILFLAVAIFLLFLLKGSLLYPSNYFDNYYNYDTLLTNDFYTTALLFFNNKYCSTAVLSFFLIIFSCFIIKNMYETSKTYLWPRKKFHNSTKVILDKLSQENNFMNFKKKLKLHFFKKTC